MQELLLPYRHFQPDTDRALDLLFKAANSMIEVPFAPAVEGLNSLVGIVPDRVRPV